VEETLESRPEILKAQALLGFAMEEPGSSSNPSTPLCLKGTSLTSICCQRMEKGRTVEHSLSSHAILQPVAGQSSVPFCRGTAIYINGVSLVQRIKKHGLL